VTGGVCTASAAVRDGRVIHSSACQAAGSTRAQSGFGPFVEKKRLLRDADDHACSIASSVSSVTRELVLDVRLVYASALVYACKFLSQTLNPPTHDNLSCSGYGIHTV
jgi:hypothetical protein